MTTRTYGSLRLAVLAALVACGGSDGGTPPVVVDHVVITSPAIPPTLHSLALTVQFAAEPQTSSNTPITGKAITWSSSATSVGTINSSGLFTATGNGLTSVRATVDGVLSSAVSVTVSQVAKTVTITPSSVTFGAIGSARQLAATATDSNNQAIAGGVVWTRLGPGTTATVSGTGLVTSTAVGTGDTAQAMFGVLAAKAPITVTQVVASVQVGVPGGDSVLHTSTRTRQFTATARDTNNNAIGSASFTWGSNNAAASVGLSTGLVTAGTVDGNATITATASGTAIAGTRIQVVTHYADTLTISPGSATITTAAGTQGFTGNAADSVGTALTIGWLSKSTSVLTVNPSSGISTTATAAGNGSTYVVITGGTRRDSALVTVSGQPTLPSTVDVTVGNDFFKSVHNTTQDPAIDTLAVGGTVTWTWTPGGINHTVTSTGSPTFISSGSQSSGTFSRTFNATGDYSYQCSIHPSMTGVVRVR